MEVIFEDSEEEVAEDLEPLAGEEKHVSFDLADTLDSDTESEDSDGNDKSSVSMLSTMLPTELETSMDRADEVEATIVVLQQSDVPVVNVPAGRQSARVKAGVRKP